MKRLINWIAFIVVMVIIVVGGYLFISNEIHSMNANPFSNVKHVNMSKGYNNNYAKQFRNQLLKDTNQDRIKNHRRPLQLNNINTNKVANVRIKYYLTRMEDKKSENYLSQKNYQQYAAYNHGSVDHTDSNNIAKRLHINNYNGGENAGPLGKGHMEYQGKSVIKDNSHTPTQGANIANQNLFGIKQDALSHDGHRANILDTQYHKLGIAVYYNPKTHKGGFVEEFEI